MSASDYIAIVAIFVAVAGPIVTWLVMKRQFANKRLSYSYEIEPIVQSGDPDLARDLKVSFKGEELPNPTLLSVVISNTGYTAIEDAKVVIQLPDATYLIPGHFVDVPTGYSTLWNIERTDAEECTIHFQHINPKQVAKVRLLMDGLPKGEPAISCSMPNVECVRVPVVTIGVYSLEIAKVVVPLVLRGIRRI